MKIIFLPQVTISDTFQYFVDGEAIVVTAIPEWGFSLDPVRHDLSPLAEGDELPTSALSDDWFGGAGRTGGEVWVRVLHAYRGEGTMADRFPAPVTVTSGIVPAPLEAQL